MSVSSLRLSMSDQGHFHHPTASYQAETFARGWDSPHNRINRTIGKVFCCAEGCIKAASHFFSGLSSLKLSASSSFPSTTSDNQTLSSLTSLRKPDLYINSKLTATLRPPSYSTPHYALCLHRAASARSSLLASSQPPPP